MGARPTTPLFVITPSLWLGEPAWAEHRDVIPVTSAAEALDVILQQERVAMIPANSWSMAEEILAAIGLDEFTIRDRIHFAQTGEVLQHIEPEHPLTPRS